MGRQHGITTQNYSLSIQVNSDVIHLEETPDNTDVLSTLKEQCQVMENKFMPLIQKWLEVRMLLYCKQCYQLITKVVCHNN